MYRECEYHIWNIFGPLSNKFSREKPQKAFDILVHSSSSVQSLFIDLRFSYWSQIGLTESFMNWTKPSYLLRFSEFILISNWIIIHTNKIDTELT